jgi:glycosyltransferase involved in cell wall biosynthesis
VKKTGNRNLTTRSNYLSNDSKNSEGLSILIPVFNEAHTIRQVAESLRDAFGDYANPIEIIIINDGSTDSFSKIEIDDVCDHLIEHRRNQGYGAALISGLKAAKFKTCAIIDADGTYPAEQLPQLLEIYNNKNVKMVIGSRTGSIVEVPFLRRSAKFVLKKLADFLAGERIPELNSGFRIFDRDIALEFESLYPKGFSFSTTITLAFICNDHHVEFEPINYFRRRGSRSKIRPFRDTKNILLTILRTIMYFDPLKVLFPFSVLLGFSAILVLFVGLIVGHILDSTIAILALSSLQILAMGLLADVVVRKSKK